MKPSPHLLRKQKSSGRAAGRRLPAKFAPKNWENPATQPHYNDKRGRKLTLCAPPRIYNLISPIFPFAGIKTSIRLNVTECIIASREQQKHHLRLCTFEKMRRRRRRSLLMLSCHFFSATQICCLKGRDPPSVWVLLGEGRQSVRTEAVGERLALISRTSLLPAVSW